MLLPNDKKKIFLTISVIPCMLYPPPLKKQAHQNQNRPKQERVPGYFTVRGQNLLAVILSN